MNIGKNITNLRKENNLTQEELANLIHVSPKTISSYETNRSLPSMDILILLANKLNTNIDSIIGLNSENGSSLHKLYEKKSIKDSLIKIIIISIFMMIIPVVFFTCMGHVVIGGLAAKMMKDNIILEATMIAYAKEFDRIILAYLIEYCFYVILLILNYAFYKKKFTCPLLIISILALFIFVNSFLRLPSIYNTELLFLVVSIIGFVFAIKIKKQKNKEHLAKH